MEHRSGDVGKHFRANPTALLLGIGELEQAFGAAAIGRLVTGCKKICGDDTAGEIADFWRYPPSRCTSYPQTCYF
jgi:hypothetical protein